MNAHDANFQVITAAIDQPRKITMKGATDLVTETDRLSEEAILRVRCSHASEAISSITDHPNQELSTKPWKHASLMFRSWAPFYVLASTCKDP